MINPHKSSKPEQDYDEEEPDPDVERAKILPDEFRDSEED
jgi:hypothetical protein